MSNIIRINNSDYIKLELLRVIQGGKSFFISTIPAKILIKIFTVDPVEYDFDKEIALQESFPDLEEYFEKSLAEKKAILDKRRDEKSDAGFQRKPDYKRAKEIAAFIENEEYPFFPNSIIVTCDLSSSIEDILPYEPGDLDTPENTNLTFIQIEEDKYYLFIPIRENAILVIDGQHRLEGLKEAFKKDESLLDNYDLIVSLILDYDRSVIAKLFYTINYTQRSVNKSLLYQLTAEFSENLDEITFLHETVKALNEHDRSPFYNRIKMLGVAPKEIKSYERRMMTISQAFLIDYLIYTIRNKNTNSVLQPIFHFYYKHEHEYEILRFLISYFVAIRDIFPEWDNPTESIISKSIGVGALIRLLNFLYLKMFFDETMNLKPLAIRDIKSKDIKRKLEGIETVNLEKFTGASSAGTLNQLKISFITSINYFEVDSYDGYEEFERNFKTKYSMEFRNWLSQQ